MSCELWGTASEIGESRSSFRLGLPDLARLDLYLGHGAAGVNLNPAVQKPRITRMTRMGTGFVKAENPFRGHPPGEHPVHRNPFLWRFHFQWSCRITSRRPRRASSRNSPRPLPPGGQSVTALAAWEDEHLPLGIEARSHAGQRRYGWRRQSGGPVPPHPIPLPKERVLCRPSREMSGCLDLSPRGR